MLSSAERPSVHIHTPSAARSYLQALPNVHLVVIWQRSPRSRLITPGRSLARPRPDRATQGSELEGVSGRPEPMNILRSTGRLGAGLITMALLAACASGGAAPSADPTQAPPDAPVTAPPSDGSGVNPNPDPGIGAKPVVPKPGQAINVHPVVADSLAARVDGNTIVVTATWTSGVEPCTILDSIVVDRGEGTFTITLQEGNSPQEIACIAIAEQHVTEFEIPDVAAGTWTITDSGGAAPPVQVTVG